MATYKQIQEYVKTTYGYVPKSCWIAHMKEILGLNPREAYNRYESSKRTYPCPVNKQKDLEEAFKHFNMV